MKTTIEIIIDSKGTYSDIDISMCLQGEGRFPRLLKTYLQKELEDININSITVDGGEYTGGSI